MPPDQKKIQELEEEIALCREQLVKQACLQIEERKKVYDGMPCNENDEEMMKTSFFSAVFFLLTRWNAGKILFPFLIVISFSA